MAATDDRLNLKQVAQLLDVHYMTVYRYVRQGYLRAERVGHVWMVDPSDVEAFRASGPSPSQGAPTTVAVDWVDRLCRPLASGDETGAWLVLDEALAAGQSPRSVHVGLVGGAAGTIGLEVAEGARDPIEERIATATATRLVAQLGARFRHRGRTRGTVVVGSPAGEHHGLALAIVAGVVRLEGYRVVELGTDVPSDIFVGAVRHSGPVVAVGIGVHMVDRFASAVEVTSALRAAYPDLPIILGGHGVRNEEVAGLMGATTWAADADAVVATIDRLTGRRRPAAATPAP